MSDWTTQLGNFVGGDLTLGSPNCPVPWAGTTDSTWPSANLAVFMPMLIGEPTTLYALGVVNGTIVSGNMDVGVYDARGTRLASLGSTAQAGVSAVQAVSISALVLAPGRYFVAVAADSTTAKFSRTINLTAALIDLSGVAEMASAFPLPATATFAQATNTFAPQVWAATEGATF